jgi:UDP-GlcNAc:undecaprenyl-phosphate/decaprenyl-phosphate GlcNAc-1-phosphate transferase
MGVLRTTGITVIGALDAAFALLVLVGLIDDRFSLSPWLRLPVHIAVALLLVELAGCRVTSLGNAFATGEIGFSGLWTYVATVFVVAAAINAFNMLDGMDGLAGTTAGVAIAALGYVAWRDGAADSVGICAVFLGAIGGFLVFNMPVPGERPLRCFMGDAGSTFLGVAVAWMLVRLSQDLPGTARGITPVTALWIGGLPLFELTSSFFRRVSRGRSPFEADAEHFHHLMIKAGFSVRGAFALFMVLAVLLAVTGLSLESAGVPEYWSLFLLVLTGCGVAVSMYRIGSLLTYLPLQARRSRPQTSLKS